MIKSLVLDKKQPVKGFVEVTDMLRPENITLSTLSLKSTVTVLIPQKVVVCHKKMCKKSASSHE